MFDLFGFPSVANYQQIDKILDCYYLAIEFLVVQRWETLPRSVASALFAYRVAGVVLFELSDARALLLVFPNLFELFFLFVLVVRRWYPAYILDLRRTVMWLGILLVPKLVQEYLLHYARVLDDLVATDVIGDAWDRVRDTF